jgi:hypothetical protein
LLNESIQWVWLGGLTLLVLGALRQLAILSPGTTRAQASGPPIGRKLPREALDRIRQSSDRPVDLTPLQVAFVTESCPACQRLLANLDGGSDVHNVVLVAQVGSPHFTAAVEELRVPVVWDPTGDMWEACQVTATPLVLNIDRTGQVVAKEVTHRVETPAHTNA